MMKVTEYKAPEEYTNFKEIPMTVFLAGTIDNGSSYDWQTEFVDKLKGVNDSIYDEFLVFNPRRDNWDSSATYQDQVDQIKWEHTYLDFSDIIIMNILPDSKSPISLMEIGMYADTGKLIVFCQRDFYRYANVDVVCRRYNIPLYNTNDIDDIIKIMLKK